MVCTADFNANYLNLQAINQNSIALPDRLRMLSMTWFWLFSVMLTPTTAFSDRTNSANSLRRTRPFPCTSHMAKSSLYLSRILPGDKNVWMSESARIHRFWSFWCGLAGHFCFKMKTTFLSALICFLLHFTTDLVLRKYFKIIGF